MERIVRQMGLVALLLASCGSASAQLSACFAGFEVSLACLTERGLNQNAIAYQHKVDEAMLRLNASYKIQLRVVNNPVEAGYDAATIGDVFTEVVRNQEMRNESFVINVTADFLEKQPEILFEASALHEVCHIMNDDLNGYHRNGANIEVAEEYCVLQVVGEPRYEQYLRAYAAYQHWDTSTYERFLQKAKNVVLVPPPGERDEADRVAEEYFRQHSDGNERLLIYNGELHDVTLHSTRDKVWHDPEKLGAVIRAGKPMVFFHIHPREHGSRAMFPSYDDFGVAALFSFKAYREDPHLSIEFRVMQLGNETTSVAYGFKGTALEDIKKAALEYRHAVALKADTSQIEMQQGILDYHLAIESFNDYLKYACPADLERGAEQSCRTHPQNFLWPSDRFFLHFRPQ
jgi:hypothetical protein